MAGRGMSVFVSIGAKLLPSLGSATSTIEKRFGAMNRRLRLQAAETKVAFKEMNAASAGLAGMAAAGGLTFGVVGAIGNGGKLAHELQMLRNAGRTSKEVAEAFAEARRVTGVLPTTEWAANIALINETTSAFGDLEHAVKNLNFNAKFGSMMANALKIDQGEANHAIAQAVQALEIRGTAMDPAKYQKEMDGLFKAMIFTKGQFNPGELKAFAQTGNIPLKMYSERFMTKVLPSLITEFGGGDVVGTMMTAFQNQIMGKVPLGGKKLTEEWLRLGLINRRDSKGASNLSRTGWRPGAVVGHSLAMSDPLAWMENVMLPALQRDGVDIMNDEQVITRMKAMFGRETGARMATTLTLAKQRKRLHKDEALINQALPLEEAYRQTLAGDPTAGWGAIKTSFGNLGASIFGPGADGEPSEIAVALVNIAKGINSIADAVNGNPILKKGLSYALLGGAGLATLKLFDVSLRLLFSPLKGIRNFLFAAGPRKIGLVGWLMRGTMMGIRGLGRLLGGMGPRLGGIALRGLAALGPWLLRGALAAFGLLSNPVGWAILAASVATLMWKYRAEIGKGWDALVAWFTTSAWPKIKGTVSALANWGSKIVDSIIAGLDAQWGRVTSWFAGKWNAIAPTGLQVGMGPGAKPGVPGDAISQIGAQWSVPPPPVAGKRANGGSVSAGRMYEINEEGAEAFVPGRSGTIIPAHVVDAMRRQRQGATVSVGQIVVQGANDPEATARAVRREIHRLAAGQSALLSD